VLTNSKLQRKHFATHLPTSCGRSFGYWQVIHVFCFHVINYFGFTLFTRTGTITATAIKSNLSNTAWYMMNHRLRPHLWILTGQFREHLTETYNKPRPNEGCHGRCWNPENTHQQLNYRISNFYKFFFFFFLVFNIIFSLFVLKLYYVVKHMCTIWTKFDIL
jgi:hypothetical protein